MNNVQAHPTAAPLDPVRLQYAMDQIRSTQNLGAAVAAGLIAAGLGAAAWAAITLTTNFQIGWMAVGIGFLVGYAVRRFGNGVDPLYGILGGSFSLLGCLVGNLLTGCGVLATEESISLADVAVNLTPELAVAILVAMFSPIDLLFYGIAVYEGYRLSFRQVAPEELSATAPV